ncbi:MAG: TolB protein [Actinomycetota bacterium]|nr:TolB protein [Actinomycetota bacterium]
MKRACLVGLLALLVSAPPAFGATGKIVFASNRADGDRELYAVGADGSGEHRLTFNNLFERGPAWSPDASRIAFAGLAPDGNWDIYTVDASGGDLRRLTTDPERDDNPRWTSDGRLVWQHGPFNCPCQEWIMNADGTGAASIPLPGNVITADPSPRGQKIAYATDIGGSWALHVAQLNGKADKQVTTGPAAFGDFNPRWASNGTDLSFLRDNTGNNNDIYFVRENGQGLRQVTNTPGDNEYWQSWSADGQSIVYMSGNDARIRSVSLADGSVNDINTSPTAPFVETFDSGIRDASLWHQITDPGGTIGEQDGRLVASISGSAVPGGQYNQVDEHWGSQCSLNGDFDYQVDYALVTWPGNSGFFAGLNAFFAGGEIARTSSSFDPSAGEQYQAWANTTPFQNGNSNTTDMSGSFRLTRTNGVLAASFRSPGGAWTQMLNAPGAGGTTVYGMGLSVQAQHFAHLDGSVAYDNFRLNAGALTCPSWWQDYSPDVARS